MGSDSWALGIQKLDESRVLSGAGWWHHCYQSHSLTSHSSGELIFIRAWSLQWVYLSPKTSVTTLSENLSIAYCSSDNKSLVLGIGRESLKISF